MGGWLIWCHVRGIDLEGGEDYDAVTERLEGLGNLGLWLLAAAADACFGMPNWPSDLPRPQASIEFDVADVGAAAAELFAGGHQLLNDPRTEPWGQTVRGCSALTGFWAPSATRLTCARAVT